MLEAKDGAFPVVPSLCTDTSVPPAYRCCPAAARATQRCSSLSGPLQAAFHWAGALAACAGLSVSSFRTGRHGTGCEATQQPSLPRKCQRPLPVLQPALEPARLKGWFLLQQHMGMGPRTLPQLGGTQPWLQPQPLPSLVAPLAPESKSGADVEAGPGRQLASWEHRGGPIPASQSPAVAALLPGKATDTL